MIDSPRFILATQSPRRIELARLLGVPYATAVAMVDESPKAAESPMAYVQRLAEAKAEQISARHPEALVLGADTVVALGGKLLGKPADENQAVEMLRNLSGRDHEVYTGLCLARAASHWRETAYACTRVTFRKLREEEIIAYVGTGEPLDKAGAYGIQGRAAIFVERIEGCYFNVVGLPVSLLDQMLSRAGLHGWSSSASASPPTPKGPAPEIS